MPEFHFHQNESPRTSTHNQDLPPDTQFYHIIPPSLIVKFLQRWLNNDDSSSGTNENENFHDYVQVIYERFKRSLRKIMIHEIKQIYGLLDDYEYNFEELANENYFFDIYTRWFAQSRGGNILVGPRERGVLDSSFRLSRVQLISAFEVDAELILGQQRYQDMLDLNTELIEFVENSSEITLAERLIAGVKLFVKMLTTFEQYESVPINWNQWKFRELDEDELSRLNDRLKRKYKKIKFWAIKKPNKRFPRFLKNEDRNCYFIDKFSKQRWNEFIVDSMKTLIVSYSSGTFHTLNEWECNLTKLYYRYRFNDLSSDSSSNVLDCLNANFDTFLHSHILNSPEWKKCLYHNETKKPKEWCQAWRRIMLNANFSNLKNNVKLR